MKTKINEKGVICLEKFGNTVSSSIPIALANNVNFKSERNIKILIVGFGVGLSWGGMFVKDLSMEYSTEIIRDFLKKFAEALEMDEKDISLDSNLSDLNLDSLAIISAISIVDEFFDKVINMSQLNSCQRIKDIIELVKEILVNYFLISKTHIDTFYESTKF